MQLGKLCTPPRSATNPVHSLRRAVDREQGKNVRGRSPASIRLRVIRAITHDRRNEDQSPAQRSAPWRRRTDTIPGVAFSGVVKAV